MIVYDLVCAQLHRFEGWFASTEDYARQHDQTMIRCPVCDDAAIERRPSANVQVGRAPSPDAERETPAIDAGEAEALNYDEAPKRGIRGQASPEEAESLRDEGIDFMSLPGFLTRDLN